MLIIADFLDEFTRDALFKYTAFLKRAEWESRYCVVADAAACLGDETARAVYGKDPFEGWPFATRLTLNIAKVPMTLTTGLRDAVRVILFLADDPDWLFRVSEIDPGAEDDVVIDQFGIDAAAICRADVGAYEPGAHLAPHEDGYAYYLVENNGEVSIVSWSESVMAVALHLVAQREAERTRLPDRIAKMPVA